MDNYCETESELVLAHQPCPDCGSSDALSEYSDGHTYCFACSTRKGGDNKAESTQAKQLPGGFKPGEIKELNARKISRETCKAFNYQLSLDKSCQIAHYTDDTGVVIAQKLRFKDKTFGWLGDGKNAALFGKSLWRGADKRQIVITEGEIDALSVYEVTRGQVPVVSLQNGAQSAAKSVKHDLAWIESFESVVLCFDNDEPGIEAAKKVAAILSPGKAKIVELPLKDANDMLKDGRTAELYTAIKAAKTFRPDGVLVGKDLSARAKVRKPAALATYPWEELNTITRGMREGELVTVTAGSGTGKTSFFTEIAYSLAVSQGITVGLMLMEESPEFSTHRLWGHYLNVPLQVDIDQATDEQLDAAAAATTDTAKLVVYDHQGEGDLEAILGNIRYMIHALGCKVIFLDNLSTIVAGMDERDERRAIDKFMRSLWQFAQREKVVIFLAVHLKRIEGNKGHEDGAQTSLSHLRGSGAISSNSNLVIGLERNQQGDDPDLTVVRILKNRLTGQTGVAGQLKYSRVTGRLTVSDGFSPFKKEEEPNLDF